MYSYSGVVVLCSRVLGVCSLVSMCVKKEATATLLCIVRRGVWWGVVIDIGIKINTLVDNIHAHPCCWCGWVGMS